MVILYSQLPTNTNKICLTVSNVSVELFLW
jgi:hypothetical protein